MRVRAPIVVESPGIRAGRSSFAPTSGRARKGTISLPLLALLAFLASIGFHEVAQASASSELAGDATQHEEQRALTTVSRVSSESPQVRQSVDVSPTSELEVVEPEDREGEAGLDVPSTSLTIYLAPRMPVLSLAPRSAPRPWVAQFSVVTALPRGPPSLHC